MTKLHYGLLDEAGILEKKAQTGSHFVISVIIVGNFSELKRVMKFARRKAQGRFKMHKIFKASKENEGFIKLVLQELSKKDIAVIIGAWDKKEKPNIDKNIISKTIESDTPITNLTSANMNIGEFLLVKGGNLYLYSGDNNGNIGSNNAFKFIGDITDDAKLKGDTGPTGEKGDTGIQGVTGPTGEKGDTGALGPTGDKGDAGVNGTDGIAGATGEKGDTGATGAKGDAGSGLASVTYISNSETYSGPTGTFYPMFKSNNDDVVYSHDTFTYQPSTSTSTVQKLSMSSDIKLKQNIKPLTYDYTKDLLLKLNPVEYTFINDVENATRFGLIAQEVEESFKDVKLGLNYTQLDESGKENKYLSYLELIAPLIKVVNHLVDKVEKLELEIETMKNLI